MYTDLNVAGNSAPNHVRGWEAPTGNITTFPVPDGWKSGRIWVKFFFILMIGSFGFSLTKINKIGKS